MIPGDARDLAWKDFHPTLVITLGVKAKALHLTLMETLSKEVLDDRPSWVHP